MENSKIKLIIFDAYGPIITGGYPDTCKYLAKRFKKNWEDIYKIIYKKYFNMAAERKITQKEAWVKAIADLKLPIKWQEVRKIHYDLMGLNKKTIEIAKKVRKDFKTLLLSKNTRSQFNDTTNRYKCKHYFDYAINTWELGLPKASKKTLQYIMKKFSVKTDEIILIDDQPENLIEAKKMKIKTILYKNFNQFRKDLNNYLKSSVV